MGSPERAERIASTHHPLMRGIVKQGFRKCGNCRRRIECGNKLIDVNKAILYVQNNSRTKDPDPGMVSNAGGSILFNQCLRCDRLSRCLEYWTPNADPLLRGDMWHTLKTICSEDEAARMIEGVLRDQGLTTGALLKRVAQMWLECQHEKEFDTAVEAMRGKA